MCKRKLVTHFNAFIINEAVNSMFRINYYNSNLEQYFFFKTSIKVIVTCNMTIKYTIAALGTTGSVLTLFFFFFFWINLFLFTCIPNKEYPINVCFVVNGYTDVECHVKGDLSRYTKEYIRKVKETVAAILDCREEDILLNGVRHSSSFLLSLSVKKVYIWKLLNMSVQDQQKLRSLDIDYLIIDKNAIDLKDIKGKKYNFMVSVFK